MTSSEAPENELNLWKLYGDDLFDQFEKTKLGKCPPIIRNIMKLLDADRVSIIAEIDDGFKRTMENFMKNDFSDDFISNGEKKKRLFGHLCWMSTKIQIYHRTGDIH